MRTGGRESAEKLLDEGLAEVDNQAIEVLHDSVRQHADSLRAFLQFLEQSNGLVAVVGKLLALQVFHVDVVVRSFRRTEELARPVFPAIGISG